MICQNCGGEIAEGMKFCGICGTPVALTSEDDELLIVEKIEFEKIQEDFFNCTCDSITLLSKIEKIYKAHPASKKVLDIYLPLLADTKDGAERALDIAANLSKDILSVYLIAVDIGIEQNDLAAAEQFLNKAKKISQGGLLLLCRECSFMLALYKEYKKQNFLDTALELAKKISEIETADVIEKSWQLKIKSLIMMHQGEKAPRYDLNFCKENNLVYRIVAWMDAIKTSDELKASINGAQAEETLLLKPGIYNIDYPFEKPVTIKTLGETIFTFRGKILVKADLSLYGIKVTGNDRDNSIDIMKSAKVDFENCIFDKCGLAVSDEAEVNLTSCEICNAENGIDAKDDAVIIFREGKIHDITNAGITISAMFGEKLNTKSKLEGLNISNCGGMGIDIWNTDAEITDCEISFVNISGISLCEEGHVEINNCKVHDVEGSGFNVKGCSPVITNCEAYGCKLYPDSLQQYNDEIDNYIECIKDAQGECNTADLPFRSDGSVDFARVYEGDNIYVPPVPAEPFCAGFLIESKNVLLENCKSCDNESIGYKITCPQNITLKGCEAYNNETGFSIYVPDSKKSVEEKRKEDVLVESCKSTDNIRQGFYIEGDKSLKNPFSVLYRECETFRNGIGFSKGIYRKINKDYLKSRDPMVVWDEISLGKNCSIEFENCISDDPNNKKKGIEIVEAE